MKNDALADSTKRLADAVCPRAVPTRDESGGLVGSLTEGVMGITAGLFKVAEAIHDLAEGARDIAEAIKLRRT